MKNDFADKGTNARNGDSDSLLLRNRLLMLHRIGNDLSTSDSFDELCRQAVILGRQLLEYRRIGIWFRRDDTLEATGSFGVDEEGKIRDERSRLLATSHRSPMGQVLSNKHPILVEQDCPLRNDHGKEVGKGVHIIAALRDANRVIGCICIDNFPDQKTFNEADFDMLGMYASIIGHLAFRKRAEDELKKSLIEKEMLLREVSHRVKNNLQVISSLLSLQSSYVRDTYDAELFRQSQNRVRSMAKVYDTFHHTEDLTRINIHDYITGIIQNLFQSYQIDASSIVLRREGHPELFPLTQAIPCGLIANELVTNALKHGFQHGKSQPGHCKVENGEITIAVHRMDHHLSITIGNNGAPFPAEVDICRPLSLGLQLVNTLVSQLNGTISLDKSGGTRVTITFPDKADSTLRGINDNCLKKSAL